MGILVIDDLHIEVTKKKVKYIHLKIYPPYGDVKISAPRYASNESIRMFVMSKISWVKQQQAKVRNRKRATPLNYVSDETHYFAGKGYMLKVIETGKQKVVLRDDVMEMYVKPGTDGMKRKALVESLYRKHLKDLIPGYIEKWEPVMNVKVNYFNVKRMRTKWGTCNIRDKRIWLSLELAKRDVKFLEYVVVHEMVHLLERNHTKRFYGFMDQFLPQWRGMREELNKVM